MVLQQQPLLLSKFIWHNTCNTIDTIQYKSMYDVIDKYDLKWKGKQEIGSVKNTIRQIIKYEMH